MRQININDRVTVRAYSRLRGPRSDWANRDRITVHGRVVDPVEPGSEFTPPRVFVNFGHGLAAICRDEIVSVEGGPHVWPPTEHDTCYLPVDFLTDGPVSVRADWVVCLEPAPPGGWPQAEQAPADLPDGEVSPATTVDPLADRLAKAEQRLDALVAAMREVARKDSVHPSVRFLADTIALSLGVAAHG